MVCNVTNLTAPVNLKIKNPIRNLRVCSWVRFHNGRKKGKIVFVVCEQNNAEEKMCVPQNESALVCTCKCADYGAGCSHQTGGWKTMEILSSLTLTPSLSSPLSYILLSLFQKRFIQNLFSEIIFSTFRHVFPRRERYIESREICERKKGLRTRNRDGWVNEERGMGRPREEKVSDGNRVQMEESTTDGATKGTLFLVFQRRKDQWLKWSNGLAFYKTIQDIQMVNCAN